MNIPRISLLALIAASALLSGCSNARGRASVMARFPNADVAMVPDNDGQWIVRQPDGSIWYAEGIGLSDRSDPEKVYNIVQILPPK